VKVVEFYYRSTGEELLIQTINEVGEDRVDKKEENI